MSRNKHRNGRDDDSNRHNGGGGNGIPYEVKQFAHLTLKKHKKEVGDYIDSKKELKKDYYDTLLMHLPKTIDWLLKNSHKPQENIQQVKTDCYARLVGEDGPGFVNHIIKFIKKFDMEEIENIEYFPIVLFELIGDVLKYNKEHEANPEEQYSNPDELYELCTKILGKRLKKAAKKGIPDNVAFDLLCIVPTKDAIGQFGTFFRVRLLFDILYKYGAEMAVPFDTVIKFLVDEGDYKYVIGYALQERKDKYKGYNETQKALYNAITSWTMNALEDMSKGEIKEVLENYIRTRKRDEANGKDGVRRYYLTSLPDSDYPKLCSVVDQLLQNEGNKKYL